MGWLPPGQTWDALRILLTVFRGAATDTDTGWTPRIPHEEWDATRDVSASDPLIPLASVPVGAEPWPAESIAARANRIEALTDLTWINDPSSLLVAARDVDAQPATDLLDDLANTASLSGGIWYDPAANVARFLLDAPRTSRTPDLTVGPCDVFAGARLVESVNDVVNDVTVTYVNPDDPDAAPEARFINTGSRDDYGTQHRAIATELVDPAAAMARAQTQATRYGVSAGRFTDVQMGSRIGTSRAVAEALLVAVPGLRLRLASFPAPAPPQWDGYTEGWELEVDAEEWAVTLKLSPASWSGPLLTWADVDPATTWADVDPAQRWIDTVSDLWTVSERTAA